MPTPDKNNKIDVQAFIDAQAVSEIGRAHV